MTPFQGKLRIRHLEIVLAVAGFGTLSKAAVQLNMTQPGLSRALVDIEESVGGTVFERTAKGMRPTALGQALCRHADAILGDLHKAETDLAAVARGKVGSLRVGCFSMFSSWPLSDAVRRFRATHPANSHSVEIGRPEKLIEDMDAGSLDILISRYPPNLNPEVYRAMPFLTDGAVLTCSPAHPLVRAPTVSLEDCVRYPWITAPSDSRIQIELETKLRHLGLSLPETIGALSLEFGHDMTRHGSYLWLLPQCVAAIFARRGDLFCLPLDLGLTRNALAAIWRRDKPSTRHVRAFVASTEESIRSTYIPGE
jgi:DNA-binding transcriptional LysR family regulator